jgi:formylglycine-generating enzyme required for sulfatase activity
MKRTLSLAALLLLSGGLSGQTLKFPKRFTSVSTGIPGTQLMIDNYEVSLGDWFAFVYDEFYDEGGMVLEKGFEAVMPDTNKMPAKYLPAVRMFRRLEDYANHEDIYFPFTLHGANSRASYEMPQLLSEKYAKWKHENDPLDSVAVLTRIERLLSLPVVGVSFAQVQQYLAWRQKLANEYEEVKKTGYKVKARLMRPEEWVAMADSLGPHFPKNFTPHIDSMNALGCYLLNVRVLQPCPSFESGVKIYGPGAVTVSAYFPDRYGLYNTFGNVWEMTEQEGIAIGGSWNGFANACDASNQLTYTAPREDLGFRCVLEFYR